MRGYKGKFRPANPQKYAGDPTNITYRSYLEFKVMRRLDLHDDVTEWASEEIIIPYRHPVDKRVHRYFPDLWFKNKAGETWLVEIKPAVEVVPPVIKGKITRHHKRATITYAINQAKWKAAQSLCEQRGWKWKILTDKEING